MYHDSTATSPLLTSDKSHFTEFNAHITTRKGNIVCQGKDNPQRAALLKLHGIYFSKMVMTPGESEMTVDGKKIELSVPAEMDESGNAIPTDVLSVDNVDPVMGADLRNSAILAAFIAIILMLIYISIRFDFRSGLAAIISLAHDVLVMLGAYVLLRIPMNMTFIAAALTILGYSINATIVIFDRVRENRKLLRKNEFDDVVNVSIWQTMTRSVNTTLTTLFTIAMVAILGVASLRNFAIPLCVGIVAGLYSSIFLSGPFWTKFYKMGKKKA